MLRAAFAKADDAKLRDLDVESFVNAAVTAFPGWLRPPQVVRLVLVTAGSMMIIIVLVIAAMNG